MEIGKLTEKYRNKKKKSTLIFLKKELAHILYCFETRYNKL